VVSDEVSETGSGGDVGGTSAGGGVGGWVSAMADKDVENACNGVETVDQAAREA
jgi:hypothetical protein